ncbi:G-protein coupled receptor 182 [Ambystoma mexicanum]|uniref:G-protein coupled receptor 182 n=1 Tax=Ambystoma mexicanum TaxID=8296 RepID=UPI0037E918D3
MEDVARGAPESTTHFAEYGDVHNWTDLLDLFNHTFNLCEIELDENVKRVMIFILYLIIFIVGLVANLLVVWVNWQSWKSRSAINIYILNMALADLGVVLSLPVWMLEVVLNYSWLWGWFLCRFTHYFYFANMYASIFFLTGLSVDRYLCTRSTLLFWRQHQQKIRRGLCITIWVLALLLPLPEVVHMQTIDSFDPICIFMAPFESYDEWALAVSVLTTIIGFLIPFPIILVCNILTARYIKTSNKPDSRKHCWLIYAYIIVFLICWLPYHLTLTLLTLQGNHIALNCYVVHLLYFFYDLIDCFSLLHCLANPILYNFLSRNFRAKLITAVVKYIPKEHMTKKEGDPSTSTTGHSIVITKDNLQGNSVKWGETVQACNIP